MLTNILVKNNNLKRSPLWNNIPAHLTGCISGVPRNFVLVEGVQQIQLRTERKGIWGR